MDKLDPQVVAKTNPKIDLIKLAESIRIGEELRRAGVTGPREPLASPLNRKRATVVYPEGDPRTAYLRHPSKRRTSTKD